MADKNELKVRFNDESKDIEVVINDAVIGNVEPELWKEWVASEFPEPVDTTVLETERDHWKSQYETLVSSLAPAGATGPTGPVGDDAGATGVEGASGPESEVTE